MGLKTAELEPTRENLLNTLSEDLLDRNKSVWQFARFCDAIDGKCSIALEAKWGSGKTFFVQHTQMLIEAFNPFSSSLSEEEANSVKGAFAKYIKASDEELFQPQVCVYYDAWANDNDSDPILSLVYEIIRGTAQHYPFTKGTDGIKASALIASFFTGKNFADIVSLVKDKDPLSELREQKEIHETVEEFLESLLFEQGNRLIVFIDELDRCKPEYAVKLLERIKHYFTNDRITFVFSVNIDELQHAIKRFYGEGFDACKYLDRFFDYRITLPAANTDGYYQKIGLDDGWWIFEAVCKEVIKYCSFELREIEKYYRTAKVAAYKITHSRNTLDYLRRDASFALLILTPVLLGLRMKSTQLYYDFISGQDPSPLLEILGTGEVAHSLCNGLLNGNETYDSRQKEQKTLVTLKDKLTIAYHAIFDEGQKNTTSGTAVGEFVFSNRTKELAIDTASLLSGYACYE